MKMKRKASISPDGKYRWLLIRRWSYQNPTLTWIMLNPSLADGEYNTPTIERVIQVSKILGYGGCVVVNLYAWRSPSPRDLKTMSRAAAIGPKNDYVLGRAGALCRRHNLPAMVAWGSQASSGRAREVIQDHFFDVELMCLGTTNKGHPLHPRGSVGPLVEIREMVCPWHPDDLKVS